MHRLEKLERPGFREQTIEQTLRFDDNLRVRSRGTDGSATVESEVVMVLENGEPHCSINVKVSGEISGVLAVALRPYNPEGISAVDKISLSPEGRGWLVNGRNPVTFDRVPTRRRATPPASTSVFRMRNGSTQWPSWRGSKA